MINIDSSAIVLLSSNTLLMVLTCAVMAVLVFFVEYTGTGSASKTNDKQSLKNSDDLQRPPGPKPFPIIGNLACMDGYEVPYQAFDDLAKKYGPIISLRLGSVPTVVVNGIDNIKEVLLTKSSHFDSRPNFRRYHALFSGNKQNSLAFCNWSDVQKMRRDMLTQHSFPRNFSIRFQDLNDIIKNQMHNLVGDIQSKRTSPDTAVEIKPIIMDACANIFTQYYCSRSFASNDTKFKNMIKNFDQIFWEVNQGYAADFLPFLLPLHTKNLKRMERCAHEIREFILENIIDDRRESWTECNDSQSDYVESLIDHVQRNLEPKMEWGTALFALEDILGGHSATGNFLVKIFGFIGQLPEVQQKIQQEIDATLTKKRTGKCDAIELSDRNQMPYTEAVIMEALRLIASPIVPHVASQDSSIGGYLIEKDSLIFLNNYNLSMSPELWDQPTVFKPERFIQNGHIVKPDHFLPFGAGRRSCMGYKMVQFLSFSVIANCMQHFDMRPPANVTHKVAIGSLAVPEKSYEMVFSERA
ncbi:cytochrome P450 307a1-like [Sitodiplosis mosellana]|uniref:cytochrome P450 307a1-like n=1 Tax=Sitodiplosis mosellana TaxID=263140 RepID=UPI002443DD67|nr:cytochrome P450 307a1-like [Sitodiplosis mosellana]